MSDPTQKLVNKGDKFQVIYSGQTFDVECVGTTVVDYERMYRIRFSDGSEKMCRAHEISAKVN